MEKIENGRTNSHFQNILNGYKETKKQFWVSLQIWSSPLPLSDLTSVFPLPLFIFLSARGFALARNPLHILQDQIWISLLSTCCFPPSVTYNKSLSQTSIQRPMNSHSVFQTHTHTHTAYWGKTDSQFLNHSHTASQHSSWTQLALSQQLTPASSETFNIKLSSTWWRFDGCIHTVRDWQLFTNRCSSQTVLLLVQPTEAVFLYKRITKGKPLLYSDNRKSFMYL